MTTEHLLSADEDHLLRSEAVEQLYDRPWGEVMLSTDVSEVKNEPESFCCSITFVSALT